MDRTWWRAGCGEGSTEDMTPRCQVEVALPESGKTEDQGREKSFHPDPGSHKLSSGTATSLYIGPHVPMDGSEGAALPIQDFKLCTKASTS